MTTTTTDTARAVLAAIRAGGYADPFIPATHAEACAAEWLAERGAALRYLIGNRPVVAYVPPGPRA